jgi:glutamine amidotransferase
MQKLGLEKRLFNITIIDYSVGNINAFVNVYKRLNVLTKIAKAADLEDCQK